MVGLSCGVLGLLLMAPAFWATTNSAPVPAGAHALAEGAAGSCAINGAVFNRSLATATCQQLSRLRAVAAGAESQSLVRVRRGGTAVRANQLGTSRSTTADVAPLASTPVSPAPKRAPVAPSPVPGATTPVVPVPVVPVPVVPPLTLDPLLRPADDGGLVDVVVDVNLDLDLDLSLDLGL